MALLNVVVSKVTLTEGQIQEVYVCPAGKTHATLDLTFLRDDLVGSSLIAVALTTEANPAAVNSVDSFVDDIELVGESNTAELSKVIVGQGQRLFIKCVEGDAVTIRVSGVEENNPKVAQAGRLAAASVAGTGQTQLYANQLAGVAYTGTSITIFNTSTTTSANVEMWFGTGATPSATDKVMLTPVPANDTTIVENVILQPNEKIFVRSSQANTEYFVNGIVVLA